MKRVLLLAFLVAALASAGCGKKERQGEGKLRIAGASNLVFVMKDLIRAFEEETGAEVDFIPGSSGKLSAQIREGAPFDLFLSADVGFVDDAIDAKACAPESRHIYARGKLVLWTRDGATLPADLAALAGGGIDKVAIAQPAHAPYGKAAVQALEKIGVWKQVEPRALYGSNVEDTYKLASTGNADVAIIPLSLAQVSKGKHTPIPTELHAPIEQAMAVCLSGNRRDLAEKFAELVKSPAGRALFEKHGYEVP
ncbi:MAG TPA: molybdate ABC transporter substrate-binding protein [Kofleriaceae bacterium]|nr:molybdate ABC transporter substrate-binding protein [Kofleriaceae bacterium]